MLNLQSLSITSVFNNIVNFFKSQENNTRWKDLTTGSEGSFLIRLLSNVFSAISYRIVAQSRENYLSTAALLSSNTGIAVNLGYSVYRGSNLKRKIKVVPTVDYTFPKLSVIGSYDSDYDIIVLGEDGGVDGADVTFEKGKDIILNTVVGKVKEESFTAITSAIKIFSLFTTGISEDYVLFLDGVEVPTTKVIKELKDDKYLVRTNPFSSVDIAYLNTFSGFKYTYGTGSEFTIRYVELADVPVKAFTKSMFPYCDLTDVSNISSFIPFESVDQIKVTAPLDHELQNLIRSKYDYAGRLKEIIPSVIDSNYKALTPTYTLISYLKDDFTLLTGTEVDTDDYVKSVEVAGDENIKVDPYTNGIKPTTGEIEQVDSLLREERFFGTPLADITPPRRAVANLKISVALTNKYTNISDVDADIYSIIESYYDSALGVSFSTFDLERRIENLSYVRYARVSHVINSREVNQNYQLGYIMKMDEEDNKNFYMVSKILGITGNKKPQWNVPLNAGADIDTGRETLDGNIYWRTYKRLPNMNSADISAWSANASFGVGDYVYDEEFPDYMFKVVDLAKSSGYNTPDLSNAQKGDFILDGGLVWVTKDYSDTYEAWEPLTNYRLGRSVQVQGDTNFSLELISYTGTTGTGGIDFETPYYTVSSTLETGSNLAFTVAGNKTFYFRSNEVMYGAYEEGYKTFTIARSFYNRSTGLTTIVTSQSWNEYSSITFDKLYVTTRGTRDGQILWSIIDDTDNITYDWNEYVTFSHTLDIIDN